MRRYITASSKYNEIKMLMNKKHYRNKVFVLLEGKTDIKLFRKLFDTKKVQLESLDGKRNVDTVINLMIDDGIDRAIGIADADFDHINNTVSNLYLTDTHDTETMIIQKVGIDSIIAEFATENYHDGLSRNLHTKVFETAYEIGLLKMVNCLGDYGLSFKEIDFYNFITINGLNVSFNQQDYINEVIHYSENVDYSQYDELLAKIDEIRFNDHCRYMICCGHDVSLLISMIMSQRNLSIKIPLEQDEVESVLRVSYGFDDFSQSLLYSKISAWCASNDKHVFLNS
ncbi:DUF4435 domain-containing protein [Vibrio vulnificus]|nr:DUF4435 domain-containing protein [Vibrio vulnificus]